MPFINLSSISSPSLNQQIETFKTEELASLFTRGEVLEATVAEKLGDQKVVMVMKDQRIVADSEIPLSAGEKISVKVDQLQPKVTLRIIGQEQAEAGRMKDMAPVREHLMLYRSNPDALKDLIAKARDVLTTAIEKEPTLDIQPEHIQTILKTMEDVVFTKAGSAEPDFVRNYVGKLGLVLENTLMKLVKESGEKLQEKPVTGKEVRETTGRPGDAGPLKNAADNLKSQLMRLSDEIEQALVKGTVKDGETRQTLTRLGDFANHAVKTLESQQIVNVLSQENDGRFILQIPLQMQAGIHTADVYIEKDRDPGRSGGETRSYRVVCFLDMDAIGSVMVDASIKGQQIGCVIKCETEPVRDFALSRLSSLEDCLAAWGYRIDFLSCIVEKDIDEEKREYVQSQSLFANHVVNVFA